MDRGSGQQGTKRVSLRIMGLHRGRSQGLREELDALCDVLETAEQYSPRKRGRVLEWPGTVYPTYTEYKLIRPPLPAEWSVRKRPSPYANRTVR